MGAEQEAIVRQFLDAWGQGEATPDVDRIMSMFAPNAVWQLWVPGGPVLRGHDAIRGDIARQLGFSSSMQCGLINIASDDRFVYTERLDHFTVKGKRIEHYLTAVFEIDTDGLIAGWREYFDTADIARQIGVAAVTA